MFVPIFGIRDSKYNHFVDMIDKQIRHYNLRMYKFLLRAIFRILYILIVLHVDTLHRLLDNFDDVHEVVHILNR